MVLHSRNLLPSPTPAPRLMESHVPGTPLDAAHVPAYESAYDIAHDPLLGEVSTQIARIDTAYKNPHNGEHHLKPAWDWADPIDGFDGGDELVRMRDLIETAPGYTPKPYEKIFLDYMESATGLLEASFATDDDKLKKDHPGKTEDEIFADETKIVIAEAASEVSSKEAEIKKEQKKKAPDHRVISRLQNEINDLAIRHNRLVDMKGFFDNGYSVDDDVNVAGDFMEKARYLDAHPSDQQASHDYHAALLALQEREEINSCQEVMYQQVASTLGNKYVNPQYTPPAYTSKAKATRQMNTATNAAPASKARQQVRANNDKLNQDIADFKLSGLRREMAKAGKNPDDALKQRYHSAMKKSAELFFIDKYKDPNIMRNATPEELEGMAAMYGFDEAVRLNSEDTKVIKDTKPALVTRWIRNNKVKVAAIGLVGLPFIGLGLIPAAMITAGILSGSTADDKFRGLRPVEEMLKSQAASAALGARLRGADFGGLLEGVTEDATLEDRKKQYNREKYQKRGGHILLAAGVTFGIGGGVAANVALAGGSAAKSMFWPR